MSESREESSQDKLKQQLQKLIEKQTINMSGYEYIPVEYIKELLKE